ncbi:hypothetical protein [Burkholderia singularis]|uniref:hypothetical protein n=1 Tax=Burkholderia singularis TaxID=1503053 RepID=UPI00075A3FC4|nr:hypothetical protein [Burkholderia singularis]
MHRKLACAEFDGAAVALFAVCAVTCRHEVAMPGVFRRGMRAGAGCARFAARAVAMSIPHVCVRARVRLLAGVRADAPARLHLAAAVHPMLRPRGRKARARTLYDFKEVQHTVLKS